MDTGRYFIGVDVAPNIICQIFLKKMLILLQVHNMCILSPHWPHPHVRGLHPHVKGVSTPSSYMSVWPSIMPPIVQQSNPITLSCMECNGFNPTVGKSRIQ
jgi:hypothetical protein